MRRTFIFFFSIISISAFAADPLPKQAPVPADNPMSVEKVSLGRQLYFDARLSKNNSVSCNSCHSASGSGTDNLQVSKGVDGKKGGRNSPTVLNAAFMSVQFWDGRAPSLEEQAKGPMVNPVEMAMPNHDAVVTKIKSIPGYVEQFRKVYGGSDPVTIDNVVKSIAAYERTLITPNSAFDRFLGGESKALTPQQKRGWALVQSVGCMACHSGPNFAGPALPVGSGFYQKFPMFPGSEYEKKYDLAKDGGRFEVTKNEADRGMWRVPTWRNIALTAPYFHNGSVQTLDEAVRVMAKTQLNKDLKPNEVKDIVAFMRSLTGAPLKEKAPVLPK